ncbi:Melanopsin-A [Labeo rohita]|uniref:Melanopsin-A n=1 Tax=Labeo rohita TaxID=84645 RepID=A0ABQ8M5E4_LABRO|nr:Melanopsin-A [Labeo rohita]
MSGAVRSVRKGISCPTQDPNCTRIVESLSSWNNSVMSAYRLVDLPPTTTSVAMVEESVYPFPTVDVPDHAHYTIGAVILAVGITGMLGNFLVIYAFSRSRTLRTPANLFIINLAITDFLMSPSRTVSYREVVSLIGKQVADLETNDTPNSVPPVSPGCELYAFCGALFGICSMITLMVIAVDRYFVITAASLHRCVVSEESSADSSDSLGLFTWLEPATLLWLESFGTSALHSGSSMREHTNMRGFTNSAALDSDLCRIKVVSEDRGFQLKRDRLVKPGAYVPEGLLTSCTWDYMTFTPSVRAYTMLLFIFVFFIPLIVIIYCYFFIFRSIRSTNEAVGKINGDNKRDSIKRFQRLKNEWKMAKIALIVILMLAIAKYIPCLRVLLCIPKHDLHSLHSSFMSTRRSTVTSQSSDMSGQLRRTSTGKSRLSSASDSESGWTDTEADLSSMGSRPASRQVSCEISKDTAEIPDFKPCNSSSFKSKLKSHDSGIFEKASDGTDVPISRGAIGRIPSIVITSESSTFLPSVRPSYRSSRSSMSSAGANPPRRDSPGGVQQGAVHLSTAAETPESAHPDNPRPQHL